MNSNNKNKVFKVVPPTYFYLCIIVCVTIYLILPKFKIGLPYNLIGLLLIILGVVFVLWPWYSFKKHNTPEDFIEPTALVTEGSYKMCRNPMYLGGVLIILGLAIFLGNLICFATPILFFLIIDVIFIPYEERKMHVLFGDKYVQYKHKVRRWI